MKDEGIPPDVVTFICILKVCGSTGAIEKGKAIHEEIESRRLLKRDVMLGNALVDMYAKCGMLARAEQTLDELPIRNAVSWSAVIMGYAQQGQGCEALNSFKRMQIDGIHPDEVTYLCILSACSHSGLFTEALTLFENMKQEYGILPKLEHHTCMVMVFGGAGCFDEAISAIGMMPSTDHLAIWLALLGACRKWGNPKLGRIAFDQALKL
jgi:pentatricopeptide repeat protein